MRGCPAGHDLTAQCEALQRLGVAPERVHVNHRLTDTNRAPPGLRELAPIRVNVVAPGFADTPLSASLLGDAFHERRTQLRATLPFRRVVQPEDVAALAVHIMSNTVLTGATHAARLSS